MTQPGVVRTNSTDQEFRVWDLVVLLFSQFSEHVSEISESFDSDNTSNSRKCRPGNDQPSTPEIRQIHITS
jgi:hypothetical protein